MATKYYTNLNGLGVPLNKTLRVIKGVPTTKNMDILPEQMRLETVNVSTILNYYFRLNVFKNVNDMNLVVSIFFNNIYDMHQNVTLVFPNQKYQLKLTVKCLGKFYFLSLALSRQYEPRTICLG